MSISHIKFPKKKWLKPEKSKSNKAVCPESKLQEFTNELLDVMKIDYMRFSDGFLAWMKNKAPIHIQKHFFDQVGGKLPDNFLHFPIGDGYFLSLKLELKTEDSQGRAVGKTHGKQKTYAENEEWQIVRNPKAIEKAVKNAVKLAEGLKLYIKNEAEEQCQKN